MTGDSFPPTSRYYGAARAVHRNPDGTETVYVRPRIVPAPERFDAVSEHVVAEHERIDSIAAEEIGDPEQWWRLADANGAIDPLELTALPGRRLRVPLPEGIPAAPPGQLMLGGGGA